MFIYIHTHTHNNWYFLCFLVDYLLAGLEWNCSSGLGWNQFHHNPANTQSNEKYNTYQLLYIYSIPPDDGLQICPKHVDVE